jgi:hypothetical protein
MKDQHSFVHETVSVPSLVSSSHPVITGREFRRCRITGPAFLKVHDHNRLEYCSLSQTASFLTLEEGTPIAGAIFLSDNIFRQCYFETISFVGTWEDTKTVAVAFDRCPLDEWMQRAGWMQFGESRRSTSNGLHRVAHSLTGAPCRTRTGTPEGSRF